MVRVLIACSLYGWVYRWNHLMMLHLRICCFSLLVGLLNVVSVWTHGGAWDIISIPLHLRSTTICVLLAVGHVLPFIRLLQTSIACCIKLIYFVVFLPKLHDFNIRLNYINVVCKSLHGLLMVLLSDFSVDLGVLQLRNSTLRLNLIT